MLLGSFCTLRFYFRLFELIMRNRFCIVIYDFDWRVFAAIEWDRLMKNCSIFSHLLYKSIFILKIWVITGNEIWVLLVNFYKVLIVQRKRMSAHDYGFFLRKRRRPNMLWYHLYIWVLHRSHKLNYRRCRLSSVCLRTTLMYRFLYSSAENRVAQ